MDRDASPQARLANDRVAVIGILALQGDFEAHAKIIEALGHRSREVRVPADLQDLDGLIIPGGESTVMTLGIEREGLAEPIRELVSRGTPVLGTCAGLIMLDRNHLGVLDVVAARNAFGRQLHSFEADLDIEGVTGGATSGKGFAHHQGQCPWQEPIRTLGYRRESRLCTG